MNEQLLSLTHTGEEPEKYLHSVTPPVFLNSLHVYDRFEDYASIDPLREGEYIYGRASNPTVHILERKIAELEHGSRADMYEGCLSAGYSFSGKFLHTQAEYGSNICVRK